MAGKVITIAQQKGGAGKTTLAAQLAVGLVCARARVATIDIDPQASLSFWFAARIKSLGDANSIYHQQIQGWRLSKEIRQLRDDYDFIIVDSPPHTQTDATIAIREADLVMVPVQPSPMDLWACGATLQKAKSEGVPSLVVMNRINARAAIYEQMCSTLASMNDIHIATSTLGNRVAYATSMLRGLGVAETESSSNTAVQEIFDLVREIKKHKAIKPEKKSAAA